MSIMILKVLFSVALLLQHLVNNPSTAMVANRDRKKPSYWSRRSRSRSLLVSKDQLKQDTRYKLENHFHLTSRQKREIEAAERDAYASLRKQGYDEVGHTKVAEMLRNYRLRHKKKLGVFSKRSASLAEIYFPQVNPKEYFDGESIPMYMSVTKSTKTQIPFPATDLPGFNEHGRNKTTQLLQYQQSLDHKIHAYGLKPVPFNSLKVNNDIPCTPFAQVDDIKQEGNKLQWLEQLIENMYRVHLHLDGLPVLVRSKEENSAIAGYPIVFKAPTEDDYFLFNHLKFTINYHEDPDQFEGVRITGFDVSPVSIAHKVGNDKSIMTCKGFDVKNDPSNYLNLTHLHKPIIFSYDVQWVQNVLWWMDRWDVYVLKDTNFTEEDHYSNIVWIPFVVIFLLFFMHGNTVLQSCQRGCKYQYQASSEEDADLESIQGDIFKSPSYSPLLLSVLVGTGTQIGVCMFLATLLSATKAIDSMENGKFFTSLLWLYALCGPVCGCICARIYKFSCCWGYFKQHWCFHSCRLKSAFAIIISLDLCLFSIGIYGRICWIFG